MKIKQIWLFTAIFFSSGVIGASQIYPDDPATLLRPQALPIPGLYNPGDTDRALKFKNAIEEHDLGDGLVKYVVETAFVHTNHVSMSDPTVGKDIVNALSTWVLNNSRDVDGQGFRKLVLGAELQFTSVNRGGDATLLGIKVRFTKISGEHPGLSPGICFLPAVDAKGNYSQVSVPDSEVKAIGDKMVSDYLSKVKSTKILWQCRSEYKGKVDGNVNFSGVLIATKVSITLSSGLIKVNPKELSVKGLGLDPTKVEIE